MGATFNKRLFGAWLILVVISLAYLLIDHAATHQGVPGASTVVTVGAICFALIKVRIIMREFMEVRAAPSVLRRLTDFWVLLMAAAAYEQRILGIERQAYGEHHENVAATLGKLRGIYAADGDAAGVARIDGELQTIAKPPVMAERGLPAASGDRGTPCLGQVASAWAKASDKASSAPARSRVRAARKATSLP